MPSNDELIAVAKITGFFGIKGFLKTTLLTHSAARLKKTRSVKVGMSAENVREMKIEEVRDQNGSVLVKFEGIDDRNNAEQFKNLIVFVKGANVVRPPKGSYFIHEVTGCEIQTPEGEVRGKIVDILKSPGQDIWTVNWNGKQYMIPAVPYFIQKVDVRNRTVIVDHLDILTEEVK